LEELIDEGWLDRQAVEKPTELEFGVSVLGRADLPVGSLELCIVTGKESVFGVEDLPGIDCGGCDVAFAQ
jgi:hypothetical protein